VRELGLPCLQPVSKLTLFFVVGEQPGDISGERKAERGAGNVIAKPSLGPSAHSELHSRATINEAGDAAGDESHELGVDSGQRPLHGRTVTSPLCMGTEKEICAIGGNLIDVSTVSCGRLRHNRDLVSVELSERDRPDSAI